MSEADVCDWNSEAVMTRPVSYSVNEVCDESHALSFLKDNLEGAKRASLIGQHQNRWRKKYISPLLFVVSLYAVSVTIG